MWYQKQTRIGSYKSLERYMWQAITGINHSLVYWGIYASFCQGELIRIYCSKVMFTYRATRFSIMFTWQNHFNVDRKCRNKTKGHYRYRIGRGLEFHDWCMLWRIISLYIVNTLWMTVTLIHPFQHCMIIINLHFTVIQNVFYILIVTLE